MKLSLSMIGCLALVMLAGRVTGAPTVEMRGGPNLPPLSEASPDNQETGMGEEVLGQDANLALDNLHPAVDPTGGHDVVGQMGEGPPGLIEQFQQHPVPKENKPPLDMEKGRFSGMDKEENSVTVIPPGSVVSDSGDDGFENPVPAGPQAPVYVPPEFGGVDGDVGYQEEITPPPAAPDKSKEQPTKSTKILGMEPAVFAVVVVVLIILVIVIAFAVWYILRQKKKKAMKEAGANAEVASVTPITTADGTKAQIVNLQPISEGGSSGSANP